MKYATALACMDGRFVTRVLDQLETRMGTRTIDLITTAGAIKHIAGEVTPVGEQLLADVMLSLEKHQSVQLAIVAHGDCAGNPVPDAKQKDQLGRALAFLGSRFHGIELTALFLDPRTGFQRVY